MVAILCSSAVAAGSGAGSGEQADIQSLNAVLEQAFQDIPQSTVKADEALIDQVYERGSLPVIVRLRDADLPYGFFTDRQRPRSESIAALQATVLDDIRLQPEGDETSLPVKRFSMLPAMALQVNASQLEALLAHPNVIDIVEDRAVPPTLQDSVPLIGAGPDGSFSSYTGLGRAVAILDTGVDKNHPFLAGKVVSEACYSSNVPYQNATSVCPGKVIESTAVDSALNCDPAVAGCFHGTHVAGIAAGKNAAFSGVAQDAGIIAVQVFSRFDDEGQCGGSSPCALSYTSDQIKGLERVYALRNTYTIASVNMSLSGGAYTAPCNSESQKPIIDSLRAAGIATVIASGNDGYTNSLGSPACIDSAVSVGSTTKADAVSSFSNSASFLSLLAPGSSIQSSVPPTGYSYSSGTSMAAPHVAGAWAVLKEMKPDAGVAEVLSALQGSGLQVVDTRIGAGSRVKSRIDVQNALDSLSPCEDSDDCDDGVLCNGAETCLDGTCVAGPVSCAAGEVCDEQADLCVECLNSSQCDPDEFCDEEANVCVECLTSSHCDPGYDCRSNMCVEDCDLVITYKAPVAAKLKKDKKLKLTITGGEGFDPYNAVAVGTFTVLKVRPKVKYKNGRFVKNEVKVWVLVPAGYPKGTVEVRMTPCTGLIEIL